MKSTFTAASSAALSAHTHTHTVPDMKVLKDYSDLIKTGRDIVFCWVPGHVGITGNEVADKAAKVGLNQAITAVRFPATDIFCSIKKLCIEKWQESWNICIDNKLREITSTLGLSRYSNVLSCNDSVIDNSSYLQSGEDQPKCNTSMPSYCQTHSG